MNGRWPTRAEFIAWGLHPCEGEGCKVLVNPAAQVDRKGPTNLCRRCRKRWHDRYFAEQRAQRAAAGGDRSRGRGTRKL